MFSNSSFLDKYDAGELDDKKPPTSFLDRYDAGEFDKKQDSSSQEDPLQSNTDGEVDNEETGDDEEAWPTAPPLELIDSIKGYEMVSFDATNVPPPAEQLELSSSNEEEDESRPKEKPKTPPNIILDTETRLTEEQVKVALLSYVNERCCYGKSAAKNLVVKKLEYVPAYHYELQTFSEKRETAWTYAPLKSTSIMESRSYGSSGVPPLPWEIEEYPSQPFKDEVRLLAVPNTSSVKSCHRCRGTGGVTCRDCSGKGWYRCIHCHGDGWLGDSGGMKDRCFYCQHSKHGHGHQDCAKCNTKGKVNCATCDGQGQIRCYIQLSITWKVHTAEHIIEKLDLPRDLIRDVSGQVAFEEEAPRIQPLTHVPDEDIKGASIKLVTNHTNNFSDQKIVCQRHQIRVVPITKATYEWKGKNRFFHVYGFENKVRMKGYPQRCCWGCQIL